MFSNYEIRQVPLSLKSSRQKVVNFLAANDLRLEEVDYYAGVFAGDDDELLAGGGLSGDVLKCIAVSDALRDTGMSLSLVSHLLSVAQSNGHQQLKVFTKPENKGIFENFSFHAIASAPKAILMENGNGLRNYCSQLNALAGDKGEKRGVIVMNANPFTLGHRYLVEQAAAQVDTLFIIVVKEDRSLFSYAERKAMIMAGVADIANVVVCEGSDYAISAATFPTYFLKQLSDATDTHITLDLDLFARHIAPALGVTTRYVGSEPIDALTARYNELMQEILPQHGIKVETIERLVLNAKPVSASLMRQALNEKSLTRAATLVPQTTEPYLIAHMASDALRDELNTTPKPGLVDRNDNGAHKDMNLVLMNKSIDALHPFFVQLALNGSICGEKYELPDAQVIRNIGIEAEKAMLNATCGVNTHRGALFAMGLTTMAASWCMARDGIVGSKQLRELIIQVAGQFTPTAGTHGNNAVNAHHVAGALDLAKGGYSQLFSAWLPAYRNYLADDASTACHRLLLLIMSQLDDTNVIHRVGYDQAQQVKQEARTLLDHYSTTGMEAMNRDYITRNISPGGSADMVALTLFIHSILN